MKTQANAKTIKTVIIGYILFLRIAISFTVSVIIIAYANFFHQLFSLPAGNRRCGDGAFAEKEWDEPQKHIAVIASLRHIFSI